MAALEVRKYEVAHGRDAEVEMPSGARILHVGIQRGCVLVWALVNPEAGMIVRHIGYFATGEPVPPDVEHVGTAMTVGGAFVWHVFESVPF